MASCSAKLQCCISARPPALNEIPHRSTAQPVSWHSRFSRRHVALFNSPRHTISLARQRTSTVCCSRRASDVHIGTSTKVSWTKIPASGKRRGSVLFLPGTPFFNFKIDYSGRLHELAKTGVDVYCVQPPSFWCNFQEEYAKVAKKSFAQLLAEAPQPLGVAGDSFGATLTFFLAKEFPGQIVAIYAANPESAVTSVFSRQYAPQNVIPDIKASIGGSHSAPIKVKVLIGALDSFLRFSDVFGRSTRNLVMKPLYEKEKENTFEAELKVLPLGFHTDFLSSVRIGFLWGPKCLWGLAMALAFGGFAMGLYFGTHFPFAASSLDAVTTNSLELKVDVEHVKCILFLIEMIIFYFGVSFGLAAVAFVTSDDMKLDITKDFNAFFHDAFPEQRKALQQHQSESNGEWAGGGARRLWNSLVGQLRNLM